MSEPSEGALRAIEKNDPAAFAALREDLGDSLSTRTFKKRTISGFDFSGVDLSNTEWEDCIIEGTNFEGADLSGAYFNGTTFVSCIFANANFEAAAFDSGVAKTSAFGPGKLEEVELTGIELVRCTFRDVELEEVYWDSVTVSGGSFHSVAGRSGELTSVVLRDVEIVGFDTSGLTLSNCTTNVEEPPEGFRALTGRRKQIR